MTSVIEMDSALNNRFFHFYLETNYKDTIKYFRSKSYSRHICAFIEAKPNYHCKPPQNEDERAWPSPRTWENLAILIDKDLADDKDINVHMALEMAKSCVGNAAAGEFGKYLQTLVIISPKDILERYDRIKKKFLKESEMDHIAELMKKLLIDKETPESIAGEVSEFRKEFREIHYAFESGTKAYEYISIV